MRYRHRRGNAGIDAAREQAQGADLLGIQFQGALQAPDRDVGVAAGGVVHDLDHRGRAVAPVAGEVLVDAQEHILVLGAYRRFGIGHLLAFDPLAAEPCHQVGRAFGTDDRDRKRLTFDDGTTRQFDTIVLATGADPIRLPMPGESGPPVHYLRTLADSRAIIKSAEGARRAVVLGASFIGLEVAASLRARKIEVHVVAPEVRPLERVLGPELGDFIRGLHEEHGVVFHLGRKASGLTRGGLVLEGGASA